MKAGMKKKLAQPCQQAGCEILCGKDGLYQVSRLKWGISCGRKEVFDRFDKWIPQVSFRWFLDC